MTEHELFVATLGIEAPADRPAYLDRACAGDNPLRRRVEALLRAHARAGDFLATPAMAAIADPAGPPADDTRTGPTAPDGGDGLDFLEPSDSPESLGRLGHYEVQEVVGRGGMGVVLKAFDENLHRVVAVKVMAPQLAASATARRRFTREARAAAAIAHDHVVTIHAVEDAGPRPYIVMQYVDGASLQDRLDRTGPLQLPELLRIGMQTASGLAAAHAQGLVHRDVKPANILLENGVERVKITDFGLARAADDASLTQAGAVAGTPAFMSPEQAEGKPLDRRSDLFSLGSVLYAMCTGRPPFRAGSSIGVLKRVCEKTPTPIRETNPEVPEWLAAVVEKLHAKDPAGRIQSAAEVAELLGQHLAHVQHPSVVPLPTVVKSADAPPALARPGRRKRWAVAAVLVAGLAILGTTEATGVTKVRATMMRVFTRESTQDFQVGREADPQPAGKADAQPFVVLAGQGVAERKFDTLAAAVLGASDGDTIEVRGNGPFVSAPITLGRQALTIRAGEGFRPVVRLGSEGKQTELPLLMAYGPLVLEGIEWQHPGGPHGKPHTECIVSTRGPAVHIANCRFVMPPGAGQMCVYSEAPVGSFRNCEFLGHGRGVWGLQPSNQVQVLDNCLYLGTSSLQNGYAGSHSATASIRLTRNTFVTDQVAVGIEVFVLPEPSGTAPSPIQMDVSSTIFDGPSALCVTMPGKVLSQETLVKPGYVEGHIRRMLVWRDQENLYTGAGPALLFWALDRANSAPGVPRSLAEWKRFWGSSDAACAEGRVRYQGGNLFSRFAESPDQLRPADFRLRSDSAGYRAGKDGKDLGADVDLVGPGPAYEQWKKTPEYQQWLKDTGQLRAAAPKTEPKAFVVLAGNDVAERKFDTLAEAVQGASDRDTIEVRGNGPFVTKPIKITSALTIRAGDGFRPVINLTVAPDTRARPSFQASLDTVAPLALEGLEFRLLVSDQRVVYHAIVMASPALRVANCRFLSSNATCIHSHSNSPLFVWEVRNCEFICSNDGWAISKNAAAGHKLILDNCVLTGGCSAKGGPLEPKEPSLQLTRNTFRTSVCTVEFVDETDKARDFSDANQRGNVLLVKASGNVFDSSRVLAFTQHTPGRILPPADAERYLARVIGWKGERNIYSVDGQFVTLYSPEKGFYEPAKSVKNLANWRQFWGTDEVDSIEGRVRYQGGDLLAKVKLTSETITPDDFRLRSDSAGYRAGKDGKDLGADVDLVGPGPAYERWKKTPEYQQWLKDTGQLRAAAPKPEPMAFALLGGKGVAERKFDTLAEAVIGASDGDTIEVRGNGPFVTEPVEIHSRTLTIRAGHGSRPVIRLSQQASQAFEPMLWARGEALVLEGLEFQRLGQREHTPGEKAPYLVATRTAALHIANCRFRLAGARYSVCINCYAPIRLRNCEFLGFAYGVEGGGVTERLRVLENCVYIGGVPLTIPPAAEIRLTRNTLVSPDHMLVLPIMFPPAELEKTWGAGPARVEASANVLDGRTLLMLLHFPASLAGGAAPAPADAEAMLHRMLAWRDRGNLYRAGGTSVVWCIESAVPRATFPLAGKSPADWKRFWNDPQAELSEGRIRYQGGDLLAKLAATPEQLTPDDYRLRADSAGYRAGKDGKDLGADVDLVGPGKGYEQWKTTAEYQQWLKETGQLRAEAPKPVAGAFVLLGGKGVAERKFDTLAEAVLTASGGDTIEIRGNGPFVSDGVTARHPLVIRAGAGFTPSIALSKASADSNIPLVTALDVLVLEGLELRRTGGAAVAIGDRMPVLLFAWHRGALYIANCRLIFKADSPHGEQGLLFASHAKSLSVWNSVLSGNISTESGGFCAPGGRYDIDNCVCAIGGIGFAVADPDTRDVAIRIRGNTLVGNCLNLTLFTKPNLPIAGVATPPIRLDCSRNIARWDETTRNKGLLYFHQAHKEPFAAAQAEALLPRLVRLDEKQNVYRTGTPMIQFVANWQSLGSKRGQDLADWDRFWDHKKTGSVEGEIRFQGGDLVTRARSAPEQLTAEDFRLRADSAGYKAGKDDKDLGADIDLVGPGPAYERWKKMPEYQQWLKDTGQLRAAAGSAVPKLLIPAPGAVLPNGARDRLKEYVWEFSWAAVAGATQYHLQVIAPMAAFPLIDIGVLTVPSYRHKSDGWTVNYKGWGWKVRARVDGQWTGWSEVRPFDVEPLVGEQIKK